MPPGKAGAAPRNATLEALAEGWRGFVTPSPFAFGLMLLVFVCGAAALLFGITPGLIAGPAGKYLPRSSGDSAAFATREALRLAQPPDPADRRQRLYIISDSVLAHALASDTGVAEAVGAATGVPTVVGFLATPLQRPLDQATLADYATRGRPGIVVLGLAYDQYDMTPRYLMQLDRMGRLGLRSDWADDALRRIGGEPRRVTGNYALDNRAFVLHNIRPMLGRLIVGRAATRRIDSFVTDRRHDPSYLARVRTALLASLRTPPASNSIGAVILADTVHRLQARGNRVLLVEVPVSDGLIDTPADQQRYADYLDWSRRLAARLAADYCRLTDSYRPPPTTYADLVHVVDRPAQARLRAALARCVAAMAPPGKPQ